MKLTCTKENLYQGLSITSHLPGKNVHLPILQNVLLQAVNGSINFTSTNLEIGIHSVVRGKVEKEGSYTIPSKLFFDYVNLLPNESVDMELDGNTLHVRCGNNKTQIHGLDAAEFPVVPSVESETVFLIPIEPLRRALAKVLFAVATNESRPELTGVSTVISDGRITLASTDSYRLAEYVLPLECVSKDIHVSCIVPARTLFELARIFSVFKDDVDAPRHVSLLVTEGQVVFKTDKVEIVSRLIEGVYPDYKQIIPSTFQTKAIIDREDFGKAIKAASLFSRAGLFDVTLEFHAQDGLVSVQALDATRGKNIATCAATIEGSSNTVTVNHRYLLEGLSALPSTQGVFQMTDASNPCLLTPTEATEAYRYVVMPIKA